MWPSYKPEKIIEISNFHSAFEFLFEKDHSFKGEVHDFWEFLYVIEGKIMVTADEKTFNLAENEIIFHKPMEYHKFTVKSDSARVFVMSFSLEGRYREYFKNTVLHLNPIQEKNLYEIIELFASEKNMSFKRFYDILASTPQFSQLLCCRTELFLLSLTNKENIIIRQNETPDALIYRNAIGVMEKHIHEWINVPDIAMHCNTSASTLKKLFSKFSGIGIHKFFLQMKLNRAVLMLKDGKNVSETAEALGFSSQNYFSMVFKREAGISPSSYKSGASSQNHN